MSTVDTDDCVDVQVTDCDRETADTVFRALRRAFPRGTEEVEGTGAGSGASRGNGRVVWSLVVNTGSGDPDAIGPPEDSSGLGETVEAVLYGTVPPVRRVRKALETAFATEERGTVPGEHEVEVRLRLSGRATPD
ncbi:hypothetical protein GCM10027160_53620 [Streptomyces calidiresistens]|uniref:Uncharacterized protein n=1 Tax=Streptomyces calidiresistens TaxID=1485586 RepID=A0A7W3T3T9_9ACTN|nr:hypothetical protein [Streptomyces calidiresistens]MBB0230096.1 hypothetical protein [Streptomyces calidiresistens]